MSNAKPDPLESPGFLICFAVREEAAFVAREEAADVKFLRTEQGRQLLITGMGRRNASEQFRKALDRFTPDRVLTCGFAGALNPALKIGDVLFDEDFGAGLADKLTVLGALPAKFHCRPGWQ